MEDWIRTFEGLKQLGLGVLHIMSQKVEDRPQDKRYPVVEEHLVLFPSSM